MVWNLLGSLFGWAVFVYLAVCAWPVMGRHWRALRSRMPQPGRYGARRSRDGGL